MNMTPLTLMLLFLMYVPSLARRYRRHSDFHPDVSTRSLHGGKKGESLGGKGGKKGKKASMKAGSSYPVLLPPTLPPNTPPPDPTRQPTTAPTTRMPIPAPAPGPTTLPAPTLAPAPAPTFEPIPNLTFTPTIVPVPTCDKRPTTTLTTSPIVGAATVDWVQIGASIVGQSTGDRAGDTIAMNGDGSIIAVASPFDDAINGRDSGTIRVYQRSSNMWTQLGQDIVGASVNDRWGFSLAMSENGLILAVGSPFHSQPSIGDNIGLVTVYGFENGDWSPVGNSIEGLDEEECGFAVDLSLDASILAVGCPEASFLSSPNIGTVRIYERSGQNAWTLMTEFFGQTQGNRAGVAVKLDGSGGTVAFSSVEYSPPDTNNADTGYIHVYTCASDGNWSQVGNLIIGSTGGERFGTDIAISQDGTVIAGGSPDADTVFGGSRSGKATVYELRSDTWIATVVIDGEAQGDEFGQWLDLSSDGTVLAVAAIFNNGNDTGGSVGHVRTYLYESEWRQVGNDLDGLDRLEDFGRSVQLSGSGAVMAAGAPRADNAGASSGEARVYELVL